MLWCNCYSMTMDAMNKERWPHWSHSKFLLWQQLDGCSMTRSFSFCVWLARLIRTIVSAVEVSVGRIKWNQNTSLAINNLVSCPDPTPHEEEKGSGVWARDYQQLNFKLQWSMVDQQFCKHWEGVATVFVFWTTVNQVIKSFGRGWWSIDPNRKHFY